MSAAEHNGAPHPEPNGNGDRKRGHGLPVNGSGRKPAPSWTLRPMKRAAHNRLGEKLYNRSMRLLEQRIAEAEAGDELIAEERAKARPSQQKIERIRAAYGLTASELRMLFSEMADRFGQPRRSIEDVNFASGPTPIQIVLNDAPGEAADASAGNGASDVAH